MEIIYRNFVSTVSQPTLVGCNLYTGVQRVLTYLV